MVRIFFLTALQPVILQLRLKEKFLKFIEEPWFWKIPIKSVSKYKNFYCQVIKGNSTTGTLSAVLKSCTTVTGSTCSRFSFQYSYACLSCKLKFDLVLQYN